MIIKLYKNEYIGTLHIENGQFSVIQDIFGEITLLIDTIQHQGIRGRNEVFEANKRTIIEIPITVNDINFETYFIGWLLQKGFGVTHVNSNLDNEIIKIANSLSNEEMKKKIYLELPNMSYLEKTYILNIVNSSSITSV